MSLLTEAYKEGVSKALKFRSREHLDSTQAVCAIDIAMRVGVDVWMQDLPSMDGAYVKERIPRIILSSLRPPGRRMLTCAHELGHHVFGHGTQIDEYVVEGMTPSRQTIIEECQANGFASSLLMPPIAVRNAFLRRGWEPVVCSAQQAYAIANWFGVSYTGLLDHLSLTLGLIPRNHADRLKRHTPKKIRAKLLPEVDSNHLVLVDLHWHDRAIDLAVGDFAILPANSTLIGNCCTPLILCENRTVIQALRPGKGHISHESSAWMTFVRVSRAKYIGRGCFRHLEDDDA